MVEFLLENIVVLSALGVGGLIALLYFIAKRTENKIDDEAVRLLEENRKTIEKLIAEKARAYLEEKKKEKLEEEKKEDA